MIGVSLDCCILTVCANFFLCCIMVHCYQSIFSILLMLDISGKCPIYLGAGVRHLLNLFPHFHHALFVFPRVWICIYTLIASITINCAPEHLMKVAVLCVFYIYKGKTMLTESKPLQFRLWLNYTLI